MTFSKNKQYEFACMGLILVGIIFRLLWNGDMEWKGDEMVMVQFAQDAAKQNFWRAVGMDSSAGIPNPGLSLWLFSLVAHIDSSPLFLNRFVQVLNILAILGFFYFFAYKEKTYHKRFLWFSALALFSVSPLPIMYSRKIWAQDLLPFFMFFIFLSYFKKKDFFLGLSLALIGQIHMSGFFFGFPFFFYLFLKKANQSQKLLPITFGGIIGSLPLIPFFQKSFEGFSRAASQGINLSNWSFFKFLPMDLFGLNLNEQLGPNFQDFMLVKATGIILFLLLLIWLCSVLFHSLIFRRRIFHWRVEEEDLFLRFALLVLIFYFISGITVMPHYLIILYPTIYFLIPKFLPSRRLILCISFFLGLMSFQYLYFVHQHDTPVDGEYGMLYRLSDKKKIN